MSGAAADGIDDRDIPKQEFLEAAFIGDIEKIDSLIREKKVHIDSVDDDHVTALHIAASMGNNKLVVRLLENGANINAVNQLGMTAFHYAAREGYLPVIDTLLQRGAATHLKTFLGVTALTLACAGGHADVVRRLIRIMNEEKRSETVKRSLAPTSLIVATFSKSPLICGYLADARVDLNETMDCLKGLSALSVAIIFTGLYMVRTLHDKGASVTKRSLYRMYPEELAETFNKKDVLNYYREKRMFRSRLTAESDLRAEVKKDVPIDREPGPPPQNGYTLLMYAITVRSVNSAKHLISDRDFDVNMVDNLHITSLQIASLLRVDDIIPILLQRSADATVLNKFGSTAYDLFLMSCDSVEPGQIRAQLHCHRPSDLKLNLSNSSSNLYKAFGKKNLLNKVSSQIGISSAKYDSIEPKQWLEAKVKYQPGKLRNTFKFASVEDILKGARISKRPETNECENETEATREYMEECQSFAVMCFTDFYGERDTKTVTPDYYDIAQFYAKRSRYPMKASGAKREVFRDYYNPKPFNIRPRKSSIERTEHRKPRNITMMDSASQNQIRTTPRMIKKSRDVGTTEYFSAQAGRARASASSNSVPTVIVARPRHVQVTEDMIWQQFARRQKLDLMRALKAEEIDRHSFFMLKQNHLQEMGIYSPENLAVIEEIQQTVFNRTL
ncbi:hypothetical protein L5515_001216 [Caenorhabditis briggsae]|uniref:ANK_REP_REGION domain-containing protein n=1 Tax=Caenorhabditis briggsae TaxID=6238 RepID=A0AAE9E283_CAEBR|nr:hypothetical protein L5515_001216 [Caenorhabditis briggsae]